MLNTSQMAAKLGVSVKTFRASVKSKQIPHIVVGKRRRFDPVTVEAYLTCVETQAATVNKQTWEAPPGSLWYVVAEAAIQQKRKPNILGVQQAMNGQEEYAQNPNREPLLI